MPKKYKQLLSYSVKKISLDFFEESWQIVRGVLLSTKVWGANNLLLKKLRNVKYSSTFDQGIIECSLVVFVNIHHEMWWYRLVLEEKIRDSLTKPKCLNILENHTMTWKWRCERTVCYNCRILSHFLLAYKKWATDRRRGYRDLEINNIEWLK